ncbi:DUF1934 domain-containing protein [Propionispora vibrioides]|uniref:Uncharacterized beta-barrel protein YwiB, DUF1934 family n=1 Tax=Propionispora vibrioides TaxID=112903 RepID=A0A1H8TRI4_9FIRM|nr:DUF1934 domain-containing protein [Propionispora vibrioides]SEO93133.1 Uncharacterized beta-barrel protein YwiB, DUF1934 family [Propionispora vibrioides]
MAERTKQVVVTVTGLQRDAQGEENRIELVGTGDYVRKNGVGYIKYRETELSGLEGTTTVIKVRPDEVTLLRMGKVEQKQVFRPGQKTQSLYTTPFGNLDMAVVTGVLHISGTAGAQELPAIYIEYELEIAGDWQSANTLSITLRED